MCGSLFPPARNTLSTGTPANVLQQVSNLASLASVVRGGYVLPTTLRSRDWFAVHGATRTLEGAGRENLSTAFTICRKTLEIRAFVLPRADGRSYRQQDVN